MKKQKRLPGEERKKKIVEAAIKVVSKRGFQGTKTREIAKAADISEAMIFKHFKNKDDLYKYIITSVTNIQHKDIAAMRSQLDNIEELLKQLTLKAIEDVERNPDFMRILLYSSLEDRKLTENFTEKILFGKMEEFTRLIKKGIKDGKFRNLNPEIVTQSFSYMVAGYCIFQFALKQTKVEDISKIDKIDKKDIVESFVDIFFNGIRV